jgi:predicted alpha/beta hydrolase family esterase
VRAAVAAFEVELDPLRMNARELRQLPGVGHKLAEAIVAARDTERTRSWQDVPGIGELRARALEEWCRARGQGPDPFAARAAPRSAGRAGYAEGVNDFVRCCWLALFSYPAGCHEAAQDSRPPPPLTLPAAAEQVRSRALLGGALHALEDGPELGEPVLLLHGMRYSAATWQELGTLAFLARAGFHAVAIDWPGFGATPRWSEEPDAAALLERVAAELGSRPALVVGPSMGGASALEFAARHPQRLRGLIAIAPAGAAGFQPAVWTTPTLLVWGEADEVLPLAAGHELARRLGARLEVIAGASHACYRDQPARFHELLRTFLAEIADHDPGR